MGGFVGQWSSGGVEDGRKCAPLSLPTQPHHHPPTAKGKHGALMCDDIAPETLKPRCWWTRGKAPSALLIAALGQHLRQPTHSWMPSFGGRSFRKRLVVPQNRTIPPSHCLCWHPPPLVFSFRKLAGDVVFPCGCVKKEARQLQEPARPTAMREMNQVEENHALSALHGGAPSLFFFFSPRSQARSFATTWLE